MRLPILYTMSWPDRVATAPSTWPPLDFVKMGDLTFKEPDLEKYPALSMGCVSYNVCPFSLDLRRLLDPGFFAQWGIWHPRIWLEVKIPCGESLSLSLNQRSAASFFSRLKVPFAHAEL